MDDQDRLRDRESDSDNEDFDQNAHFLDHRELFLARFLRNVFYDPTFAGHGNNPLRNEDMIRSLKASKVLTDKKVEEALLAIPREYFVTEDLKEMAYHDNPLRFSKMAFNISAPHMYAMCLEKLDIQPGHIILDIGSGSGHLTALAGYLTGPSGMVHGLDIYDYITDFSRNNIVNFLASRPSDAPPLKLDHVKFFTRNCFLPTEDEIKYDRIHVGCCCPESRINFLYDLLKPDGILVTPFGDKLIKAVKKDGKITVETLVSVRYSDLTLPSEAEIKEAKKQIAIAKANKIVVPQTVIREQFRGLVSSELLSDFTFVIEGKPVSAHKLILSLRSNYFKDLFAKDPIANLDLLDCDYETFLEFLKFVYSDNCLATEKNADQLLNLAKKFDVIPLFARVEGRDMPGCTLIDSLEQMVGNCLFSDVQFVFDDGRSLPAHKLILAVRTEYFQRMFSSGLRESQSSKITIADCSMEVFKDVLMYIYTDHCGVTEANCELLLEQANFFQLDRLKAICEQYWFANIKVSNAANVLHIADRFNAIQLKDFAMEFIFTHIQDVVKTEAFQELDQSLVSAILIRSVQRGK